MTTTTETAKNNNLQISIDKGAIIVSTSSITVQQSSSQQQQQQHRVHLTVQTGTLFHPDSHLTIILSDNNDNGQQKGEENVCWKLVVGTHNLFEERCHVKIDLRGMEYNDDAIQIIGDYNLFACMSNLETPVIGNGNAFESKSSVHTTTTTTIGDGCAFAPAVSFELQSSPLQDRVVRKMENVCVFTLDGNTLIREHGNGLHRNRMELERVLPISAKALRGGGHSLLADTVL
mmetsp:Transcript_51101/g.75860  ORF Transcript_51101/g.75860 Transcript_51101/m.75860 type:complete len:232 (-) Transcript_51101:111-806(-)